MKSPAYVLVTLFVLGCKTVSQRDLDGAGTSPTVSTSTSDASPVDAAVADSGLKSLCGRAPGALASLPELNLVQGQLCIHNRQCESGTYCQDPLFLCAPGKAGAGRTGAGSCMSGDDCTSGLCVESGGGGKTCSDVCNCAQDCGGKLARCLPAPALGIAICSQ